MNRQSGKRLPDQREHTHILDNHGVESLPVVWKKIAAELCLKLLFFEQRIHGQIHPSAMNMRLVNRQKQLFL